MTRGERLNKFRDSWLCVKAIYVAWLCKNQLGRLARPKRLIKSELNGLSVKRSMSREGKSPE